MSTLSEIMAHVDDLASATDPFAKQCLAGLILLRVCALTGDDARAEMEKRRAPCAPLKVPSHQRALKGVRAETLDEVVEHVAAKIGAGACKYCNGACSTAEELCERCGQEVPWGEGERTC